MTIVSHSSHFDVSVDDLYDFHSDVGNLSRISPSGFELLSEPGPTAVGDLQRFQITIGNRKVLWEARITRLVPGRLLEDMQETGPFRQWRHQHQFYADGEGSRLKDVVSFRLIPTPLGEFLEFFIVRPFIVQMLRGRHRATGGALRGDTSAEDN